MVAIFPGRRVSGAISPEAGADQETYPGGRHGASLAVRSRRGSEIGGEGLFCSCEEECEVRGGVETIVG